MAQGVKALFLQARSLELPFTSQEKSSPTPHIPSATMNLSRPYV